MLCPGLYSQPLVKFTLGFHPNEHWEGKVPSKLIHDLEGLPHVRRVDRDSPLVLLGFLGLHRGRRAWLDAGHGKREGERDGALVSLAVLFYKGRSDIHYEGMLIFLACQGG